MSDAFYDPPPGVLAKLDELRARHAALDAQLLAPDVLADPKRLAALSQERAATAGTAQRYDEYRALQAEIDEYTAATCSDDAELAAFASEELPAAQASAASLLQAILRGLVTADDRAVGSAIVEVRAGAGGDEAALWAAEVFEMLERYAIRRGWRFSTMRGSAAEGGGIKAATAGVSGDGAFAALAHESGVHCVKRVPATESQGRVHTSTATVAVLPEPKEVDIKVDPAEVDEHITTSQGPGGQNVNKVATAVHLVHKPTGLEVRMQEEKSQRQNREKAWRLLRARLYDRELAAQRAKRAAERAGQIGTGDRSERIRTYRFKDNLAVDHRLNESFALPKVLGGELEPLTEALNRLQAQRRLAEL